MAAKPVRLAQRRKAAGYSQEKLAEQLSVERSTIVRWESGETQPQPWVRPKLARALELSVGQLAELLIEPAATERFAVLSSMLALYPGLVGVARVILPKLADGGTLPASTSDPEGEPRKITVLRKASDCPDDESCPAQLAIDKHPERRYVILNQEFDQQILDASAHLIGPGEVLGWAEPDLLDGN